MTRDEPLRIVRRYAAPAERVFAAWSEPRQFQQWAWGSLGKQVRAEMDVRVGGVYRVRTTHDDGEWVFSGTYLEVDPPRRLVYTVQWDAPMGYEAPPETVTVEIADTAQGSEVTFVHAGVPGAKARQVHEQGWNNTFDFLDRLLGE